MIKILKTPEFYTVLGEEEGRAMTASSNIGDFLPVIVYQTLRASSAGNSNKTTGISFVIDNHLIRSLEHHCPRPTEGRRRCLNDPCSDWRNWFFCFFKRKKHIQEFGSNLPELIIKCEKYVSKMINEMVK